MLCLFVNNVKNLINVLLHDFKLPHLCYKNFENPYLNPSMVITQSYVSLHIRYASLLSCYISLLTRYLRLLLVAFCYFWLRTRSTFKYELLLFCSNYTSKA